MGYKRKELSQESPLDGLMDKHGLNMLQVAGTAKVSLNTLRRIRDGVPVRHRSILAVAEVFGVKPADILSVDQIR